MKSNTGDLTLSGCRLSCNGQVIAKDLDPAFAGYRRAGTHEVKHVKSDAEGRVVLSFVKGKKLANESRDPRICGFEIIPE